MKKNICALIFLVSLVFPALSNDNTLIHYWNFNNVTTLDATLAATQSTVQGAEITYVASTAGTQTPKIQSSTGQDFATLNARLTDAAEAHLRFNDPVGGTITFALPTTGYENPILTYVTRRSTQSARAQIVWYTLNGTDFIRFDSLVISEVPELKTLDFSSISGADNNANFKVRITFTQVGGNGAGNNRFDNVALDASVLRTPTLVHYWNFNDVTTLDATLAAAQTAVQGAAITYVVSTTGTQTPKIQSSTGQDFATLNARLTEAAEAHLRFNDPVGGTVTFALPTTGYENPVLTYVTRRSTQSARAQIVWYTLNGTDFIRFDSLVVSEVPELKTLDFSSIAGADNNAHFKVRIAFTQVGGNGAGNNRFDNVALDAVPLAGTIDADAPVVSFAPLNNAMDQSVNLHPIISFSENIRLVTGVLNYADAIVFKKGNDAGTDVAFTVSLSGKELTLVPTAPLESNTSYYVALKANSIEDLSGNKVTALQSSVFTTISVQTIFQPGDVVLVAYQMNATPNVDRFAFVTLVDILPGTKINITDAKYTDNTPAQCAGGFVWTAPQTGVVAGTVVVIENDALTTTVGTLSGTGFGLGSGGDQIIMYAGTSTAPQYITALSSNLWAASNTSCSGGASKLPATLTDGQTSINLSTATGNVSGNTANAFYTGNLDIDTQSPVQIRIAVLNPANWAGTTSGVAAQVWPAWSVPGPPAVVKVELINATQLRVIFNKDVENVSATTLANYSGISGVQTAVRTNNGSKADTVVVTFVAAFTSAQSYSFVIDQVKDAKNQTMSAPFTFTFTYDPISVISFDKTFYTVAENGGSINIKLNLDIATNGTAKLVLKPAPFSTAATSDHAFITQTVTFINEASKTISIDIVNDVIAENDEYFVVSLEELTGLVSGGFTFATIYITDDDYKAPVATKEIELEHITSFDPSPTGSTSEALAYDAATKRFFVTSAVQNRFDIVDFTNPASPVTVKSVDMSSYGGSITGIAVRNGIVAVGAPNNNEQANGSVVFFDTNGNFVTSVTVGALPDMIHFTPDGLKVLTANEGQPNSAYTVDPEGSVSVIDVSGGINSITQNKVSTIDFLSYNASEAALVATGIRKTKATSTLAQDLEPEYITFSADSKKAWVVCQENNAIAEINLENNTAGNIWALGTKDYSVTGNGADMSNNNGVTLIANWPVKGFYHPDAIANYEVNGVTYLVTANEGDEKEYAGLTERVTLGNSAVVLDPTIFPNAQVLKQPYNLGQFRISNIQGDIDNDGDYDALYAVGARSFSIFNTASHELVYDSGDDFEYITAQHPVYGSIFNSNHEENKLKGRSNAKGCEPEALDVAKIGDKTYAFIGLERVGGVMIYNITDPAAPVFVDYANTRNILSYGGDNGPEYVVYVNENESPDGKRYILVSNEISGTITVFRLNGEDITTGVADGLAQQNNFYIYPNPSAGQYVRFNSEATVEVFGLTGNLKFAGTTQGLDISTYAAGIYFVKTSTGQICKLVVE